MLTGGVNLDTRADLVIERHVLFDKFGMSNLGEHNVVVVDSLTSPIRREFGNRSMKSLNSEAVDLEADTTKIEINRLAASS
ncbi:hypothetical protein C5167_009755 [Papaver somniferum]|uniref:Uncharacterized protein n=1 Tax=Papaver somniferum TaxID=3469 RepID=A0A4Y7K157_PAPSO|nr:hypothetical protein C5167_009755 [Papaver somniferum]